LTISLHVDETLRGTRVAARRCVRAVIAVLLACGSASGDTLPLGAWPGASLEELRALRECTLDDLPMEVGAPVPCRPPVLPSAIHASFDVGWSTGLVLDGEGARGMHAFAGDAEWWLTRSLALGARLQLAAVATVMDTGVAAEALATARYRLFTDETGRDAFSLAIGGGYATRSALLGGDGAVARVALARDAGYVFGDRAGMTWAFEVAGEQSFGAQPLTMLTAGVRAGYELGIRRPHDLAEPEHDAPFRYAIGGEIRASTQLGVGASFDLPVASVLQWRTTAFWTTGHDDLGEHALTATWAAVTGPRLMFASDATPYLDVQAGPAAIDGTRLGVLGEAEAGLTVLLGCETRFDIGGRIQAELDQGIDVRTGFFILRVEHGPGLRRRIIDCDRGVPIAR
jgi:hypothetical protein